MKNRMDAIRKLDIAQAYLLTSEENVRYACGFTGDSAELLILAAGTLFFTDSRYTLQAERDIGTHAEIITTTGIGRAAAIAEALRKADVKTLAVEKESLTVKRFESFREACPAEDYRDVSEPLLKLRSVKTREEIGKIQKAAHANDDVLSALLPHMRAGVSELDIRAELVYRIQKQGMEIAFEPIVAAGENAALPHARPSAYVLREGDMLTLDFGCKCGGYCSDITRTFGVGQVDVELKKIYDIVWKAQEAALAAAKRESSACAVDAAAREVIEKAGYGAYFGHGTGHGVGLQIHERPVLNASSTDILENNMVYTVEPGVYVPGLGGVRIEDTCVHGVGSLNSFGKELIFL